MPDKCFKCGKKLPDKVNDSFMSAWEAQTTDTELPWVKVKGWIELFFDPDLLKGADDEQLWFVALCPDCVKELSTFLIDEES